MNCYECKQNGSERDAIGLCRHCGAALCSEHAHVIADPITTTFPMLRTVVLPKHARLLLCATCKAALQQPHAERIGEAA
jgi:hypothetical protein